MKSSFPLLALLIGIGPIGAQTSNYPVGSLVPNFTVNDVDGGAHDLYTYTAEGKHVLLAFWFEGCIPCMETAPKVAELFETFGCNGGDLVVLRVNAGIDMDWQIEQFGALHGGPYSQPPAINSDGSAIIAGTLGVFVYPTYCIITPDNVMHNDAIWPVPSIRTFVDAFPNDSDIQPASCSALSITSVGLNNSARIFPVPTTGLLHVELQSPPDPGSTFVVIHDALGRSVHSTLLPGTLSTFDLNSLHEGMYSLTVIGPHFQRTTHQFLITR